MTHYGADGNEDGEAEEDTAYPPNSGMKWCLRHRICVKMLTYVEISGSLSLECKSDSLGSFWRLGSLYQVLMATLALLERSLVCWTLRNSYKGGQPKSQAHVARTVRKTI